MLTAFALLFVASCSKERVDSTDASEPLAVTFGIGSIDAPPRLPTGMVTFAIRTSPKSDEPQIQLLRLEDDTVASTFFETLADGDLPGVLRLARPAGGINLDPGGTTELFVELDPARYVFLDPDSGTVSKMLEAAGVRASEPSSVDGVVALRKLEIALPSEFGDGTYLVENTDGDVHGLTLIKLDDGVTLEAARKLLASDTDLPGIEIVRAGNLGPGTRQIIHLDLRPGHYLAASYFPDPQSGSTQAALGMVTEFTVKG